MIDKNTSREKLLELARAIEEYTTFFKYHDNTIDTSNYAAYNYAALQYLVEKMQYKPRTKAEILDDLMMNMDITHGRRTDRDKHYKAEDQIEKLREEYRKLK